ncbi:molybdenum ABC transporter ATP-binding protein [Thauera sp. CAU 1555]|uniref:Molybdenum ABC transporter ATP-binding protein n=1 Tax=Thauera sedimentorum TaxID=2767595 RepID=A0ABR9BDC0_9RHOO|nr:molybdenum ABC transporter ATP-binding protein [Thauera sedimentorum]MBC9073089.1 molybdenum ABC transporter ATP-binding protein [Thauera sedimentorum]MBD8504008.1 molybdenum ABC transporter ATP-binding protein [Thauera sedimentorum]
MSIEARFRVDRGGFVLDVDLSLPARGVSALFGRSGSGKTTLLRCVAGLEQAAGGRLVVNGETWQDGVTFLPTHKRPLGYVFQEASLFPHLDAAANMRYGLRRTPAGERRVGWDEVIELLGIGHLLTRYPDALSGGERQRVALARALLTSPRLLLMDEPLSALDHARKQEILPYLERLHDELDIPVLYVSHAPDEVARLADHVVLMEDGRVVTSGGLQDTLARLDLPLAFAEDAGVVIEARVGHHDERYHLTRLDFPGGHVFVARRPEAPGNRLRFRVHARDVSLAFCKVEGTSITNLLPAMVSEIADADTPAHVLVRLEAEGTPLIARITRRSLDQLQIEPGLRMWAQIKAVALLG